MTRTTLIAAASLLASTLAVATAPAAIAAANETEVRYGDLDLSTEAGRATLDTRIARAARAVCSSKVQTGTMFHGRIDAQCFAQAKSAIERQIAARTGNDRLGG